MSFKLKPIPKFPSTSCSKRTVYLNTHRIKISELIKKLPETTCCYDQTTLRGKLKYSHNLELEVAEVTSLADFKNQSDKYLEDMKEWEAWYRNNIKKIESARLEGDMRRIDNNMLHLNEIKRSNKEQLEALKGNK